MSHRIPHRVAIAVTTLAMLGASCTRPPEPEDIVADRSTTTTIAVEPTSEDVASPGSEDESVPTDRSSNDPEPMNTSSDDPEPMNTSSDDRPVAPDPTPDEVVPATTIAETSGNAESAPPPVDTTAAVEALDLVEALLADLATDLSDLDGDLAADSGAAAAADDPATP